MFPQLKIYNVDYDFLVSNYLNKDLWKKSWNLFVYKDNVFTLSLHYIDTECECVNFKIRYNKLEYTYETVSYYLNNTTIPVLKKSINGAMFRLMERYDESLCKETKGYKDLCEMFNDEVYELTELAENYLDDCGVTQEDIREVYIDNYVSNNTRSDIHKSNYVYGHKYQQLTDMFIVFTKITDDKNRYNSVVERINDTEYIKRIEDETKEFKKYFGTDEYKEEMNDNLLGI